MIVLILLAVLVLLIAPPLFVPIRYTMVARRTEHSTFCLKASWFLNMAGFVYRYDSGKDTMYVHWLWKRFGDKEEPNQPKETGEAQFRYENQEKTETKRDEKKPKAQQAKAKKVDEEGPLTKKPKEPKKSILDEINFYLSYPDRDVIIEHTCWLLKKWKRALRPRSCKIRGTIGFSDPAVTGAILGFAATATAFLGIDTALSPNFDEAVIDCNITIMGEFMLWSLLWVFVAYVIKKPIWKIIRNLTRKENVK